MSMERHGEIILTGKPNDSATACPITTDTTKTAPRQEAGYQSLEPWHGLGVWLCLVTLC
jgi:hypothetical protein